MGTRPCYLHADKKYNCHPRRVNRWSEKKSSVCVIDERHYSKLLAESFSFATDSCKVEKTSSADVGENTVH